MRTSVCGLMVVKGPSSHPVNHDPVRSKRWQRLGLILVQLNKPCKGLGFQAVREHLGAFKLQPPTVSVYLEGLHLLKSWADLDLE